MARLVLLTLGFFVAFSMQDDLQDFMEQAQEDYKILGMTIGAFAGNEWLVRGQIGVRNADDPTLIGENDKFVLSDAGRSITAMLAARIVESEEITWETTIQEVFGETIDVQSPFGESTLLDLLVHRGLILNNGQLMNRENLMEWYDQVWAASQFSSPEENVQQRLELTKFLVNVECEKDMCYEGAYSKFTYSIAVAMLEKVTGKTFDDLLEEEVFGPLGAPDCGLGPTTLDQSLPPAQPWSHFCGPWGVYNLPVLPGNQSSMPSSISPDVGIHCSIDSWKNVLSAHLARNQTYLSTENWDLLQTEQINLGGGRNPILYAPGFIVDDSEPETGKVLYHPGSNGKDYATCYLAPNYGIGVVVAANSNMQDGMKQKVGLDKIVEYVWKLVSETYGINIGVEKVQTLQVLLK